MGVPPTAGSVTRAPSVRRVHAGAWWIWALALGVAATRTTNAVLLVLIAAVAGHVVITCRVPSPWAQSYGAFLRLAAVVLVIRVVFHILLGGVTGPTVWFRLPEVPLPDWAAGVRLGGPVSAEGVVNAAVDGLRLGVLLACVGAANSLADPRRLLRSLPAALSEVTVAIVVALTTAPQLIMSASRIRKARQLRGATQRGLARFASLLVPVIEDAFDRSLSLAATMDSRGYGRMDDVSVAQRRLTGALLIGGLGGMALGAYGSLDTTAPDVLGFPVLVMGGLFGVAGLVVGSRRVPRTRYRPDLWRGRETLIAASGVAAVVGVRITEQHAAGALIPPFSPLEFPQLPVAAAIGVLVALAPSIVARTEVAA